jgi:hypothetical protein
MTRGKIMAKKHIMLTFPRHLIKEPVVYKLSHEFKLVTNIRRADVSDNTGWVILELEGEPSEIDSGINWARKTGVRVDSLDNGALEG